MACRDHRIEDNVDLSDTQAASLHEPIPAHNVGYRLLERMGWRAGCGLGRQQQGALGGGAGRARGRECRTTSGGSEGFGWLSMQRVQRMHPHATGTERCLAWPCSTAALRFAKADNSPAPLSLPAAGVTEPVKVDLSESGMRLGLGRLEAERQYVAAEFVERRQLETELQADEDDERRQKREVGFDGKHEGSRESDCENQRRQLEMELQANEGEERLREAGGAAPP